MAFHASGHRGKVVAYCHRIKTPELARESHFSAQTSDSQVVHYAARLQEERRSRALSSAGSLDLEAINPAGLVQHGEVCAWTLARAPARSGDGSRSAPNLGAGDSFAQAVVSNVLVLPMSSHPCRKSPGTPSTGRVPKELRDSRAGVGLLDRGDQAQVSGVSGLAAALDDVGKAPGRAGDLVRRRLGARRSTQTSSRLSPDPPALSQREICPPTPEIGVNGRRGL